MKQYFCKSLITGNKVKTKRVLFYSAITGCFKFGFLIRNNKNGLKIRLKTPTITSKFLTPSNEYSKSIACLKTVINEFENKFGSYSK